MEDAPIQNVRTRDVTAFGLVRPYGETAVMVALSTFAGMLVAPRWGSSPVDLLYLPAVLAAAALYGLGPGLVAAVGSALAFNYYFTAPFHTLRITSPQDVATVILLFIVALVTSQLAARMRQSARNAEASASRNATIAGFARRLLSTSSDEQIGRIACRELARLFDCNAVLMAELEAPALVASRPSHASLTPSDFAAAAWAMQSGRPAGRGTEAVNATEWVFYPVRSDNAVLAAVGLARDDGTRPVVTGQLDLLDNLTDQLALAMERSRLERETRDFEATRERDRLRSALLSTIGQDVAPRLATILRAVAGLRRGGSSDKEMLTTIGSEAMKLDRYLTNLNETGSDDDLNPVEIGGIRIDLFHRAVSKDGAAVHLTPKEFAVLAELAKHPGRVLSHGHLLRVAWGPAQEHQTDYLRVAIRALRQKLETNPSKPRLILNEPAVGYRLASNG